jgi:branched-chain amino acid transport system ATP-binding protein
VSADAILEARGLRKAYGGLTIFEGLDFTLRRGERHAIIGPNGAGKSTFIHLVSGLTPPSDGSLWLEGREITAASPRERVRAGLVRTFQINTLFPELNPLESLVLALCERDELTRPGWRATARCRAQIDEAQALLERFSLGPAALKPTRLLPYGEQRLLEVALALALRPRVLLLDEPAAGLSTAQGAALFERVAALAGDTTLLFIEHDMHLVFKYAQRVSVFAAGRMIAQDRPEQVRRDPAVQQAYLGH